MPIQRVTTPPEDGSSYVLDRMDGEIFTMSSIKGVFRFYASQKQTNNTMSVFAWDGSEGEQPFHHHKKTHDCFLIVEGNMEIYCDGTSRILGPGDFASVPPGIVHKPVPLGPITKCIPLINPADWVDAFRYFSRPFDGVMFPEFHTWPEREPNMSIEEFNDKYDAYPDVVENPPAPLPWSERDTILPDGKDPYFLRCNSGPRWALGGVTSRPFATTKQSSGKFAISNIESSDRYGSSVFSEKMAFPVFHIFIFFDGKAEIAVGSGDEESSLPVCAGDVVCIQENTEFSIVFKSKYVRFFSWASGDGIEAIIHEAGEGIQRHSLPDEALPVDEGRVRAAIEKFTVRS